MVPLMIDVNLLASHPSLMAGKLKLLSDLAALHDALGRALKESRRQQESEKIIDMLISWIMHLSQHKLLRTRPKVA